MNRGLQGKYVTISTAGETAQAFIPDPLPPNPPIDWPPALQSKFDQALLALGRLDSASSFLPDTSLFLYLYVRKEAVLSSMIEGTQSSLIDLLLYEIDKKPGVPLDDVQEVSSYVAALEYGLQLLKEMPLSLRLIQNVHSVLMNNARGGDLFPGEFRRSQNWIGGTRPGNAAFVPPPPKEMVECINKLELFLHNQPEATPVLVKAALSHVQFETIHPFLDGNGRLGRLLITLILCDQHVLSKPMLYLSLYFKIHRNYYYELLNTVRENGDWETWLYFFADAVIATASQAVETSQELIKLSEAHQNKISSIGRMAGSALSIHRTFMEHPVANSKLLVEKTGITAATVNKVLGKLEQLGIIEEITNQRRNQVFCYSEYLDILNKGTELIEM